MKAVIVIDGESIAVHPEGQAATKTNTTTGQIATAPMSMYEQFIALAKGQPIPTQPAPAWDGNVYQVRPGDTLTVNARLDGGDATVLYELSVPGK